MSKLKIDINCDLGESFEGQKIGNDEAIFPYITSCNIACGFHGGGPVLIQKSLLLAKKYKTRIGAHPSYPDLKDFGRTKMNLPRKELIAIIKYQISAIKGMAESEGLNLEYVKPHGALYNTAVEKSSEAKILIKAILEVDNKLALMGLAGSEMEKQAQIYNIAFIAEAFADRTYDRYGQLVSRIKEGAVIHEPHIAAQQALMIVKNHKILSVDGTQLTIKADSICIHGDNPQATAILEAIDKVFKENNIYKTCNSR